MDKITIAFLIVIGSIAFIIIMNAFCLFRDSYMEGAAKKNSKKTARPENGTEIVPVQSTDTSKGKEELVAFNEKFVAANKALTGGTGEALRSGIALFIESLDYAGEYKTSISRAIEKLCGALSKHDRADTKGPWNRDLSGYGILSWKADLYGRDVALRLAWDDISRVNESLKSKGLGWHY